MAEAIVSFVLESFRDLIVTEAKLLGKVGGEIGSLEAELERMMSFLKDADARQNDGDSVHTWIKQVRNIAYRAQDVLEKYAIQVKSKNRAGIKKLLCKLGCISIHNVAIEIETIKSELINLRESLQTYGIKPLSEAELSKTTNEKPRLLRQTFVHVEDSYFVGMEDDIKQLVSFVVDIRSHNIISIYGMGGSGKTTMARNVSNHPEVQEMFDAFAWVCITQSCDKIAVLQDILKQLDRANSNVQNTNFGELVRDIAKIVQEKKCFVVLDDIWNIDDWKILSRPFVGARTNSKVLITTRKYNIAKVGFPYEQRLLDEEESLQLLQNKVLNNRIEHIDSRLEKLFDNLGREMVLKCGGLPLAISALGGILRTKLSKNEWMDIHKDIGSTLTQGLEGLDDSETTNKVLALSYQDLPHFLKPCFLYMSAFLEDEVIFSRRLYHLWIAEGMISPRYLLPGETLMNVAERFLQELNLRSIVQLQMDWIEGKVKSCKLHDLMRDLCLAKAKEEEFLERTDIDTYIGDNARRISVHLHTREDESKYVDKLTRHQVLRSLSVATKISPRWDVKYTMEASQVARFKLLRVLHFENLEFHGKKLPNNIGELMHLRYLSLSGCDVVELPSSVGNLPVLQILDLRVGFGCKMMIPYDIFSKKKQLIHLYLGSFSTTGPSREKLKLDGLSDLQTLFVHKDIYKLDLTGLSGLVNIRYFKYFNMVKSDNDWPLIMKQIKSWKRIQLLHISMRDWDGKEDIANIFMSHTITHMSLTFCKLDFRPTYEHQWCQNLVSLEIVNCVHVGEIFDFLGKLPNLRRLVIDPMDHTGSFNVTEMAFPQLKLLKLNCKKLTVSPGCLPNLIKLKIGHCDEIVPEDGLKYLYNLEELLLPKYDYASEFRDKCWKHHPQYAHISIKEVDILAFIRWL